MNNKIKIGIIGCGRVAGHHAAAIHNNPHLEIVAASDLKEERLSSITSKYKVPGYMDFREMLRKHHDIEVVSIVTPSGLHYEQAYEIVTQFHKHVAIEKPIVMTLEQGQKLKEAAQIHNVYVFPVHQYRFNRCVQRIRNAVLNDELGQVFMATVRMRWCRSQSYYDRDSWRGTYAMDGGCTTNQGIHHLDLLRYINGEVRRVNAMMRTVGSDIEVEDTVCALLEFENGSMGSIEVTTAARPCDYESSLSILGTKGTTMLGGAFTDKLLEFSPNPDDTKTYSDSFVSPYGLGHYEIYKDVCSALRQSLSPRIELDDALKTMKFLHALYVSAERGGAWVNVDEGIESNKLGHPDEELFNQYRFPITA